MWGLVLWSLTTPWFGVLAEQWMQYQARDKQTLKTTKLNTVFMAVPTFVLIQYVLVCHGTLVRDQEVDHNTEFLIQTSSSPWGPESSLWKQAHSYSLGFPRLSHKGEKFSITIYKEPKCRSCPTASWQQHPHAPWGGLRGKLQTLHAIPSSGCKTQSTGLGNQAKACSAWQRNALW